jgi:protein-disulfide isomerase
MNRLSIILPLALLAAGCHKTPDAQNATVPTLKVAAAPAPAGQDWTQVVSQTPEGGFRMGNPDAALKVVEYGSRTCPTCGLFGRTGMQPLENNYVKTGKVSYEFREFFVHGAPDVPFGLLGTCAGPAPFFGLLEAMYKGQEDFEKKLMDQTATAALQTKLANATPIQSAQAWADYMGVVDFVKQRGIPEAQARACLSNQKELERQTAVMQDASQNKGVTGTPSFFLNGKQLENVVDWASLEQSLKQAGA